MRKTKIICTIGPASEKMEILEQMFAAGMNIARLNFSHGTYEEHQRRIDNLRRLTEGKKEPLAIMLDTRGPEIRTGKLEKGKVKLESGQRFILTTRDIIGNQNEVHVNYPHLPEEVEKGTLILLSDGLITLMVEDIKGTEIICQVVDGGELGEKKGVNIPGVSINLPFISEKDREDILFGIKNNVDYIAASFVRTADDVLQIRRILESKSADIDIIAKIESQEAVNNLDDIIRVADGIMVARGDLGVEIPAEEVPLVQKRIVEKCNQAGKMVIIATQMLESMINNPRPTRAEVSDVANAIFEGADAVMLSGETAAGKYPVIVVETMAKIAKKAEEDLPYEDILRKKGLNRTKSVTDAISYATCATASNLDASAIITATRSGHTAKIAAKYRPQAPIIAATPDMQTFNKLALVWGVYPVLINETEGSDALFQESISRALEYGYVKHGDLVVLTAGAKTSVSGGTNLLKVHIVGEILLEGMGIGETVNGKVKIVVYPKDVAKIEPGDIVVTTGADEMLAPFLDRISGLIAEEGGLTSNAAIMGLNYNLPVIVGAHNATRILKDNMMITMDTPRGKVYRGLAKVK
ncbi:pyruvate kinase [Thermosyntropha sp.]|uniref:pyruvate kinase n=1 Tax=Thermosyntropha sp. TaxID=2740820 RepID=UPI0025DB0442|nr:pyruvate kinase [Thermosyntropha sp.]MBO8158892.1 pyruvate kinase [Thermosyntropha sp.]